ncbi:MAG: hypothetical protein BA863_13685 [Desulfovibrio sp. S3730MH75]|nr:MAG: hypothetical protein BA863_13685 [Desulfovibrio sp. S3730MH75]
MLDYDGEIVFTSGTSTTKNLVEGSYAPFFDVHTNPEPYLKTFADMIPKYLSFEDKWGVIRVVIVPFTDVHGRKFLFGAGMKVSAVEDALMCTFKKSLFTGLVILLIGTGLSFLIASMLSRPFIRLSRVTQSIADGNLDQTEIVPGSQEVRFLSKNINSMSSSISNEMNEAARLRSLLQNVVDSMPSIIVAVDELDRVIQWNLNAEQAFGISSIDALGQGLEDICPSLKQEMNSIHEAMDKRKIQKDLRKPRNVGGEVNYEDVTIYPLVANGITGAVVRIDDVTSRIRMEEMIVQSEKMISLGGLAAGMAHEINNPLGGIIQSVQNIKRRLLDPLPVNIEVAKKYGCSLDSLKKYMVERKILKKLDEISDAGNRSASIVANMLSFSRASESTLAECDLNGLLDFVLGLAAKEYDLNRKFDFKKVVINRDYTSDLPSISCVRTEIEQVLLNLLSNAMQAMAGDDSDKIPQIILRTSFNDTHVTIEVGDNGPGLDKAICKRIFEPFFTTKPVGVGTGLGLSVSYYIIVQNHHGEFYVQSTKGHGANFTIKIPRNISC